MSFSKTASAVDLDAVATVAELKNFLRVEHTADDSLLTHIRKSAVEYVEQYTNTLVGGYACTGYSDGFYSQYFPIGPVAAIASVEFLGADGGDYSTLSTTKYFVDLDLNPARIRFYDTPKLAENEFNRVKINFSAGFNTSTDDVPPSFAHAVYMLAANMYEQRLPEVVGTISSATQFGVRALLAPHRIMFAQ